jgi:hypothetical protein
MKKPLSILPNISGRMICPSDVCSWCITSVGWSGGLDVFPTELSMLLGLVNPPLDDGDSGTPLMVPEVDGDLESSSEVLRR